MKRRFRIIWTEVCKLVKPVISIIVIFAGGVIPFIHYIWPILPTFYSIIICSMLFTIIILSVLVWNLSLLASSTTWYDREYSLMKVCWNYFLSNDKKSLDAEYLGERKFTCRDGEIKYLNVEISKDEPLIPFNANDNYNLQLIESYRDKGVVQILPPHKKEGTSFAFRIEFNPPLIKGETAYLKYRFNIPHFQISNLDDLREIMKSSITEAKDYEYNSFYIIYPIQKFHFEIFLHNSCCVTPIELNVKRVTSDFYIERDFVMKQNLFKMVKDDNGWRLILERENPPIDAKYIIKWRPPRLNELNKKC